MSQTLNKFIRSGESRLSIYIAIAQRLKQQISIYIHQLHKLSNP
ncbi:hypothetical protein [Calothrix sp. PCC 7507]|nr:hypothetical protein [Calothrix sp. PCC 7507]